MHSQVGFFQVQILVDVAVKIAGLLLLQRYCYATTNATYRKYCEK